MEALKQKRILVMLSSFNGEKYIKAQIESILNQNTIYDVFLRIRDDGSNDDTCKIVESLIDKNPGRIELIKGDNLGSNASFFSLINSAEGFDYYSISDQDDVWLADKLQIACDALDAVQEDIPLLYASTSFLVKDDLLPYGTTRRREREMDIYNTIIQNICPGHTQVMNNKLISLLKNKVNIEKIYVYDSWIQNIANLYGRIIFDNNSHTYYRQYEGNQLGSGAGIIGQLFASIRRGKTNDGHRYRKQIEYFIKMNEVKLKEKGFFNELNQFVMAKRCINKIRYTLTGKLYRQKKIETIVFYIAVLIGKY